MRAYVVATMVLASSVARGEEAAQKAPPPALQKGGHAQFEDVIASLKIPSDSKKPFHHLSLATGDGFAMGVVVTRGSAPLHKHMKRAEALYVVSGTGTMRIGDKTFASKPGTIMYIPPDTPHAYDSSTETKLFQVQLGELDPKDFILLKEPRGK